MTETTQSIALSEIGVPSDRIRPVDEQAAQALAALIREQGQLSPVAVYRSNAAGRPFTLIYGARRLRALEILGIETIEAVLRTKAEAAILEVTDNLSISLLGSLEQAEHLWAYQKCWEERHGSIARGGDRRSKFHTETLIERMNSIGKLGFYKDIEEKFSISKSTAWRLLKIANLQKSLRDTLRGTPYAYDQRTLLKLVRYGPKDQIRIADALAVDPDLEQVLREPDPETGREGVGRMVTGDWREKRFWEAWNDLPLDRRAAALDGIGALSKPVPVWPAETLGLKAVAAPGNRSPIWSAMRDPFARIPHLTYQQIKAAKEQYEREELERQRLELSLHVKIQQVEDERRPEYRAQAEEAKAKGRRFNADGSKRAKRGRRPKTPEQKRVDAFGSNFIRPLADVLIEHSVPLTAPAVRYLRRQSDEDQYVAACFIGNGHGYDLNDIKWKIARAKEV